MSGAVGEWAASARPPLGRRFLVIWAGQSLSQLGSNLAGIGTGVWVFLETGSARWLGLLVALAALPTVLVAPLTRYVDRWRRRSVMLAGDTFAAAGSMVALALVATDRLEVWHLAVTVFVGGIGSSLQAPAFQAAVPSLVDPGVLGRANGLNQFGPALGFVVGPALGTPIAAWWGIGALLVVDLASFAVAIATTLAVDFGDGPGARNRSASDDGSWRSALEWLWREGRPLTGLLALLASTNFVLAAYSVSLIAVAVEVGGAARSGLVLAAGGGAMVAGSIVLGARGLPVRRVRTISIVLGAMAFGSVLAASRPSLPLLVLGSVVALAWVPAVTATTSTIFHERVPAGMQGRVFGLRFAVGQSLGPIGSSVAGLAIARVTGPAMRDDAWGGRTIGRLIGDGAERGPALLLIGVAAALVALSVAVGRSRLVAQLDAPPDAAVVTDRSDGLGGAVAPAPVA